MATLEEMTAWAAEDIAAEIQVLLGKDASLDWGESDGGLWWVHFIREDEEDPYHVESGLDERLALLNAYGYLWARSQPETPEGSPWRPRRRELTERGEVRYPSQPDPEDLDPQIVESMYGGIDEE